MNKILTSSIIRSLIINDKPLYLFRNLCISGNTIAFDLYTLSENTPPSKCINFHYLFHDEDVLETFEKLTNKIEPYVDIQNKFERGKICLKILESALYIASIYTEYPNLDYSNFEHIITYRNRDGFETYTLKGLRYFRSKFYGNGGSTYRYAHNLEGEGGIYMLIQKMNRYLFGNTLDIGYKDIYDLYSRKPSLKKLEIFVSKKKKDRSLYLVDKCGNKAVSIKLPDELKKEFEKSSSVKLNGKYVLSLLPNKIQLYSKSGNPKEDLEKCKSIILSWLPNIKHRKMLFTSFTLLLIKIKSKHISIDKDIFERFKITDTKASYDKLYDIADLLIKIMFDKYKYKGMKNDFSLN